MEETITPAIRICDVRKRYGQHEVLQGIDMEVMPKEVVCLIGPSGSGKSTLLRCVNFLEVYDEGEILVDGQPVHFRTPLDARRYGIETVYQNLAVCPALDIATNLFLGRERRKPGILGSVLIAHEGINGTWGAPYEPGYRVLDGLRAAINAEQLSLSPEARIGLWTGPRTRRA